MFPVGHCVSSIKSLKNIAVNSARFYRFGNRNTPSGYHVLPKWFDQKLLAESAPLSALNQDAKTRLQNRLFDEEKSRQESLVNRVDKIEVLLEKSFPKGDDTILMMNAGISTPFDCAKHISEMLTQRSALALVNGTDQWHMHQPLEKTCTLRLLHFKHADVMQVNEAFWRSCSMLLASVVRRAFKDDHNIEIVSPLMSDVRSGSFVCDVKISSLTDWTITDDEKRILTSLLWEATSKDALFERLSVNVDTARKLFADSPSRLERIENSSQSDVVVYRVNEHLDISESPLISRTSQIGSIFLASVHPVRTDAGQQFYRFQGVAMPSQLNVNPYMFELIRERASRLNPTGLN